jgi:hypothetical protein
LIQEEIKADKIEKIPEDSINSLEIEEILIEIITINKDLIINLEEDNKNLKIHL